MTNAEIEVVRHLVVDGVFNVRDLGGYRTADGRTTRWRTVLRADGIHQVKEVSASALAELGLRTVIDLRTDEERQNYGSFEADRLGATYHHLPVIPETWADRQWEDLEAATFLAARYGEMLESGTVAVATTLTLLAEDECRPALFHCAAGKDRTGVMAALLLDILGVDDETIATDYALSAAGMERMEAWVRVNRPEVIDRMSRQPAAFRGAPAQAMRLFLAEMRRRHGSAEGYAREHGVSAATIERLRSDLVE